jgi:GntR family transcriptional regulator
MQLHPEAPDPLYLQLRDTLEAEIRSGRYLAHQRLPSERDLSQQFGVSRMTARQALLEMARDGAIYTRVGKGTFVADPKIDQQLRTLTGFSKDVRSRGGRPVSRVLEAKVITPPADIAWQLRLSSGSDQVSCLSRLRLADGLPLAIETAYLPLSLCPNLLSHDFSIESLYGVLEDQYGLRLTQAEQTIEAALATSRELDLLQLTPPAAVMRMQRLTLADALPVEYVVSAYRADRYKFRSMLQAGNS